MLLWVSERPGRVANSPVLDPGVQRGVDANAVALHDVDLLAASAADRRAASSRAAEALLGTHTPFLSPALRQARMGGPR